MYLTASIRPSHMSSPTKLFMKKFLFDGHPIFPYLNLQAKIPQTGTCHFNDPPPYHPPRHPPPPPPQSPKATLGNT